MQELPPNPYAPPATDVNAAVPIAVGDGEFAGKLYSLRQMGAAAFFGSVFAGVLLLQANYRVMGKRAQATRALGFGLLATALMFGVALALPASAPSTPINIVAMLVFYKVADAVQGADVRRHLAAGGPRGSNWAVVGSVVACLVVVVVAIVAWQFIHAVPENASP